MTAERYEYQLDDDKDLYLTSQRRCMLSLLSMLCELPMAGRGSSSHYMATCVGLCVCVSWFFFAI